MGYLEEDFWIWFEDNKSEIEAFIDSDLSNTSIYQKLTTILKHYNDLLFPELTKTEDNK
jgi:hypothetical protein